MKENKYIFLSFLTLIAISSILSITLFSNSYAVDSNTTLPKSTFTSNLTSTNTNNLIYDSLKNKSSYNDFFDNFKVPSNFYTQDNSLPLYSLQKNLEFPTTTEQFEIIEDNPKEITNTGLKYIMMHGFNPTNQTNNVFITNKYGSVTDNNIKQYVTQIAIWLYIFENESSFQSYCVPTNIDENINACDFYNTSTKVKMTSSSLRGIITQAANNEDYKYLGYIIDLVDNAKSYTQQNSVMNNINKSSISYTFNDNYLISSIINPSASSNKANYLHYSVEISDPNKYGVYLVDTKNNKINNLTNLTGGFKVYIPLKDITKMDLTTVNITIKGNFMDDNGYEYRITNSTKKDNLLDNKKQKFANQMIGYVPLITANTNFTLRNFIKISKIDITNQQELPGANLEIKKDNEEVASWTSSDKPHYIFLDNGDYELCETQAPDNYELNTECIKFTVTENKIISEKMNNKPLEIPNTSAQENLIIYLFGTIFLISGLSIIYYSYRKSKSIS